MICDKVLREGRIRPSFHAFCVLVAAYSLLCVQSGNFADDPGVGWHLKNGQVIAETWRVPRFDTFLSSAAPRVWISDQWLSDLLFYFLYETASWQLLYATIFSLFIITFFVLLYRLSASRTTSFLAASIATLLAFKLSQIHYILRPVTFSIVAFAVLWTVLLQINSTPSSVGEKTVSGISLKHFLLMPFLFLLWSNLHPAFVLGLFVLIVYSGGILVQLIYAPECCAKDVFRLVRPYLLLTVLCCLATIFNPYGTDLHRSIFLLGSSSYFMRLNTEWLPLSLDEYSGRLFLVMVVVIANAVFFCRGSGRWRWFELLLIAVFAIKSCYAARFLPFFAIISAPVLADSLCLIGRSRLLARIPGFLRIAVAFERFEKMEADSGRGKLLVSALMVLVFLSVFVRGDLFLYRGPYGPNSEKYPYKAVEFILNEVSGDVVVSATPNWGGFLTWQGQGKIKPVIDDRNILLGEDAYKAYFAAMCVGGSWERYIRANRVDFLMIESFREKFVASLRNSGQFEIMYQDKVAILLRVI